MAFRVGQKVVCVLDKRWVNIDRHPIHGPKKGEVCTVRKIDAWQNFTMLAFAEWDRFYSAAQFRPVVDTDISVFIAMLTKAPKKVDEHV